ncbi:MULTISPECIES: UDP-N-acetylmuramoyl-L-alanine--D-glutamate ligase [Sphingobium]|uniref:UDP-N-acetylmuramoylalanine--D-glutamate ligase n=1 Tax=Sphingobium fuliginis (strain ATCC 27551) TaxID=336203 RepID=A0ABQ1EN44_SPHSA|nr:MULTISPECIES: UDP-N-acetylmuramoyl-L-alanine--D-glutamate ligase [Sphingobium]AJR22565.1 UDP-N-acetylmuramoylalanine--D-glutamate ligase [Sphingobium sp. YBL2]RYM01409.1 UDP-N-acetylmuramoyl-L-alanine--D-glutamate ligase [Sphingobium fuliginis]UXC92629.1 UDP-N-acetylmuramoyl-L-alanine--D-glutamate ligase [Sphingobium sp. RSMS]WDA39051.1 UDP-N-acetylmuramoyl-L-alanine--D-glutamate ligase [Sphingobium sp. YC-XJ3]GFZ79392.1 UDP-N-acetylmuramoylalanine--D-glutamate ligase [Sphingobium fuliginis
MGIVSDVFAGRKYAVLGLARSGLATVECLAASGAEVVAWDSRDEARASVKGKAELADPTEIDLKGFDGVVVSPGVPLNKHPIAMHAKLAGVPVIGDIELFALARPSLPRHRVVGITGTNGKSTTTALVHHIVETAGIPTRMGGNIGLPIMGQDPLPEGGVYVLELSSYQIDLTGSLDCDVAVLLNITPDHLDRYNGFEGYVASKARLFAMQSAGHAAVIATEDEPSRGIFHSVRHSRQGGNDGVVEVRSSDIAPSAQAGWPALQGPHNAQNAAVAIAVARALGIGEATIEQGLQSYASLPHRMQRVRELNGVLYVNDSKATNAASTAPALAAYPPVDGRKRLHWIVGGLAKTDNLDECAPWFANVAQAYTIGEAGPMFAELLRPHMAVDDSEMLSAAVRRAARVAQPGDVVLLSPACASFDQFRDFEARGDAFAAAVAALE